MHGHPKNLYVAPNGKDFLYLGYPMHLTPTEFRILHYVVQREGMASDAQSIAEHCYGMREGNAANVSVRISAINQKAWAIGGRKLLRCVQGRGYKFCDDI